MKVALLPYLVESRAPHQNLERLKALLSRVSASLAVAPELALTGYGSLEKTPSSLEFAELESLVRKKRISLLLGHPVLGKEGLRNGAWLIDSEGAQVVAEKAALFPGLDLEEGFNPGDRREIFELEEGLCGGVLLCYEIRFPEFARQLVARGAQVIFVLAQWPVARVEHLRTLARARAVENQVFVVVVGALGKARNIPLAGLALVFSPSGEVLLELREREGVFEIDLRPEALVKARNLFNTSAVPPPSSPEKKIRLLPDLLQEVKRRRALGHRLVFTNGCFDLLHAGHVSYLYEARALGDFLVVGLNSDASVRRLKGPERPINPEGERARVLASLASVDYVVLFEEDTPEALIRALQPDVLVKGEDWPEEKIVGATLVKSYGGKVVRIPFRYRVSTTALIQRLRRGLRS
ncbi:MAG: D-glycero-beta-D-manno-heptose 1-phosphate adenylyltransferase [Thermodesulfatator sp.]|nr:MAG: D-glycero-beta-D-manno-heptose 1-phosphate adenylyltransferase [Thermodesulfatator sp.]